MKRRNWMGHRRNATRKGKAISSLLGRAPRKRKSWTFERLEDRLVFSVAPFSYQTVSFGNDTPEGAAMTLLDELHWAQIQSGSASGTAAQTNTTASLPTDPMFPDQWHLLNTGQEVGNPDLQHLFGVAGQDINVVPAWNMTDSNGNPITGQGVTVAVIDTGVQLFQPDLIDNISPTLRFNAETGTSNVTPDPRDPDSFHGTAVAGIIGATANNGIGGTGVAPGVTLVP
ncbi:MAG TPA: S8 family serine peptidase, partial [Lacipirellulaceae bacterium]|nr:S8 family serine peptidase [Lacipirellulaceae bacterium]